MAGGVDDAAVALATIATSAARVSVWADHDEPENEHEHAVRHTVQEAADSLLTRWERESGTVQYSLAVLAAACDSVPASVVQRVRGLKDRWAGRPAAETMALVEALVEHDNAAVETAMAHLETHEHHDPGILGDREDNPRQRGLALLIQVGEREVGSLH